MQQNTEKQTCKRSHLQLLHSVCSHIYNLQTETCALTLDTHISLSLSCSLIVYLRVVVLSFLFLGRGGGDACLAAGTFPFLRWPVPRCICRGSSLSLQKAQRKKIRKLALMKTRSTVSPSRSLFLSLSPPPLSPSSAMNLERRERRRIKLNSNQLSAAPDDRALKCKCACVSFSLSYSLSPLPLSATFFFFYERRGKALKLCSLTVCWLVSMSAAPSKGPSLYFHKTGLTWPLTARVRLKLLTTCSLEAFRSFNNPWAPVSWLVIILSVVNTVRLYLVVIHSVL